MNETTQSASVSAHKKRWYTNPWVVSTLISLGVVAVIIIQGNSGDRKVTQSMAAYPNQQVRQTNGIIPYEVSKTWGAPNVLDGKVIVISKSYVNEADMTTLGWQLKNEAASFNIANIRVFDDKDAANLYDSVMNMAMDDRYKMELFFYHLHSVGYYAKNNNTGINEFVIYLNGNDAPSTKTIQW
ncbi:MAG: hypothetical protein C3F02_03470 [Parcubacteria group bacterium]|nr:MAG: hypothetical protein C3F02_03470 [Parcubacteria group bacterium]